MRIILAGFNVANEFYWETNITHSYLLTFSRCLLIVLDGIENMIVSCCVMYLNTT
jgi:hypothetical protein